MRPVLANLGFVLQIAGFFMLIPIISAFYFNETNTLISLFITAFALLATGFLLNALCERKILSFKSSCLLLSLVFIILPIYTSIPCQYANPFGTSNLAERFTNCYFESVSTSTTTGLSLLKDVSLSKSLVLYRGLIQWIGGIGLIFILLTFFYPTEFVDHFGKLIDVEKIAETIKKSFIIVLIIYSIIAGIFIVAFYFSGYGDLIDTASMVLSVLVTGSLPFQTIPASLFFKILLMLMMVIGATNFWVIYRIFSGNFKKAFVKEFGIFLLILTVGTIFIHLISNLDLLSSIFHVVSASSTTGLSYINFQNMASPNIVQPLKLVFIVLMFIGGCSFSTAGGIKIKRIILLFKSVPWAVKKEITKKDESITYDGVLMKGSDVVLHLLTIILSVIIVFVSAFIFSLHGFSLEDSLFECVSALSTSGVSLGITSVSLALELRWLLIVLMIIGRVEIITFLIGISRITEEKQ